MNLRMLPVTVRNAMPSAVMPNNYIAACTALKACVNIDEAADWSNKAAALATYAKQASDDALKTMAEKIQCRAERRVGELLIVLYPAIDKHNAHRTLGNAGAVGPVRAGFAVKLAKIPEPHFEKVMSKVCPPTPRRVVKAYDASVGALREQARKTRRSEDDILIEIAELFGAAVYEASRVFDAEGHYFRDENKSYTWAQAILGMKDTQEIERLRKQLAGMRKDIENIEQRLAERKAALQKLRN